MPAAGIGKRMLADCPKQYLSLNGQTVLAQTLIKLSRVPGLKGVAVGLAAGDAWWPQVERSLNGLAVPLLTYHGGQERADTVLAGLARLSEQAGDSDRVMVHDAVRPCVRVSDIEHLVAAVGDSADGGLLAVPVTDTLKSATEGRAVKTVDRSDLWRAQTPQLFPVTRLEQALKDALAAGVAVTDEASAMEQAGARPLLVEGHVDNIKITYADDLAMAGWILEQQGGKA